jgi:ribulose-bisphosphate carboxylase large chain
MLPSNITVSLSGERFTAVYRLSGDLAEVQSKAEDIRLEQTVELPVALLPPGDIRDHVAGRIESLEALEAGHFRARISFAVETTGFELTGLLNVAFGNTSLKAGVRLERLELPESLLRAFKGPRFGREGLRDRLGVHGRPLLGAALKPMGLPPAEFAQLAYQFALGGIDLIKDDHGLANQPFAAYRERVEQCAAAVARANRETGFKSLYAASITAPSDQVLDRALWARQVGAGALLIVPGLTGLDTMRQVADDDRVDLPLVSHPSFQGSYVSHADEGMSPYVLFGQINRLAGADVALLVNYGSRFACTQADCLATVDGASAPMGHLKPSLPAPAGGMDLERMPEMIRVYGHDALFFMVGALYQLGPDLAQNCRRWRRLVERMAATRDDSEDTSTFG